MQVGPQFGGIAHHPLRDCTDQVVGELLFDGGVVCHGLVRFKIGPQQPRPERVVWPRPPLFVVVLVPHRIEVFALPWRGRIERFAAAQVNTGDQDMHMHPAIRFGVLNRGQMHVLPRQSGKCQRLEVVQHGTDLVRFRGLFGGP